MTEILARADGDPAVARRQPDTAAPPLQPGMDAPAIGGCGTAWVAAADWPAILGEWRQLAASAGPGIFLDPDFACAARKIEAAASLGVLAVTRGGAWIGLVAGRFALAGSVFRIWTHDFAPSGLPLALPGEEGAVVAALLAFLGERGVATLDWDMLEEGPFAAALDAACAGHAVRRVMPHRRACLTDVPPRLSRDHRRLARRLAEQGRLVTATTAEGFDPGRAREAFLALEAAGWKGAGGTAFASHPATRAFFDEAIGGLMARGGASIDLLLLDDRPIAAGVVLIHGTRAWYWKTAYDEALARFSPGLLLSHAIGTRLTGGAGMSLVDSGAIAGHSMIDRIWPGRMAMERRLIAVRAGAPGWRHRAAAAGLAFAAEGRALAKRILKRGSVRPARAKGGG